jgi:Cof subfamily protein (haloacid dehalogenase superfamily)
MNKDIYFFCDMDGTLLSSDKTLSEENLNAILRLREAGGKFVVSTGRVIQATRHYFEPVGVDFPVILCNGGMIYDCHENKVMWSSYLPEESSRKMCAELLKKFPEACAEICTPDRIYDVQMNDYERIHWKKGGFTAEIVKSLDSVPSGNWCKILFAMPEELIKPFADYAQTLENASEAEFITSSTIFHEMLPKNCSKGTAMKKLLGLYGAENSFTVAMGDFDNDLEMLRNADFPACPSNAVPEVKAVCRMICKSDCSHGAVAEVIEYILNSREREYLKG